MVTCSFVFAGVHFGLGHHNLNVPEEPQIEATKVQPTISLSRCMLTSSQYQALITILYVVNMMFIKLSIGLFLLRLAVQKRYIWILRISMVIILIWSVAIVFYQFFQCKPVAFQWDNRIPGGICAPAEAFVAAAYSISVMTIVSDWLYSIMPIFMIWNVKMSVQKKFTVGLVLSLGIFASVATLIRLKYLIELADPSDQLYTATHAMVWTIIEPGIAIVAASLVTIRPLLNSWNLQGFGSSKNTSNYGRPAYGRNEAIALDAKGPWLNHSFVEANAKGTIRQANKSVETSAGNSNKSSITPAGLEMPKRRSEATTTEVPSGDGSSEEYILEGPRIVKTLDVTVSRNSGGDDYHSRRYR